MRATGDEQEGEDADEWREDDERQDRQVAHRTTVANTSSTIARPAAMPSP